MKIENAGTVKEARHRRRSPRGFTLIELIVAIGISVVLLSILAFIFRISTAATRDANSRISITERQRTINIRLRQEIGAMLPVPRTDANQVLLSPQRTFDIQNTNGLTANVLIFSTATVESGLPISVDVKYQFIPDTTTPEKGVLIRWRDSTGPYYTAGQPAPAVVGQINPGYFLGDDNFVNTNATPAYFLSDVMMMNVRSCQFTAVDVPLPPSPTELNPRLLPSAIQLDMQFGPEVGNPDKIEFVRFVFPIYRGL